ncbi:MAG: family 1 encapsulin nanocompartment shell protein [Bacteroidota bacterium]
MNILKKSIAPVTDAGWSEIKERTKQILDLNLTARKFVDIDGPNGLKQGGVSTGRLILPNDHTHSGINYGIREMLPMVEVRRPFELDLWELDNVERGAKDIDLSSLEEAAREISLFEERAIYQGFEPANIKGLRKSAEAEPVTIPENVNDFLKEIGNQIINFDRNAVEGPYSLVITQHEWVNLINLSEGYPILLQLKEILGGQVLINHSNHNSFLVSNRGGDYELVLGQDISLGYDGHDSRKIKLYFTSSFTFRVLSPEAVIVLNSREHSQ